MATNFVAVTNIKHGNGVDEDGVQDVVEFDRGDKVTGLDGDTMVSLWASGSLAVEGSADDPNTWPDATQGAQETTPRLIEDVLRQQAASQGAPKGTDVAQTQPSQPIHHDPAGLLAGEGPGRGENAPSTQEEADDRLAKDNKAAAKAQAKQKATDNPPPEPTPPATSGSASPTGPPAPTSSTAPTGTEPTGTGTTTTKE
jgi:hypothetical protein